MITPDDGIADMPLEALIEQLKAPKPRHRTRAISQLVRMGAEAVEPLRAVLSTTENAQTQSMILFIYAHIEAPSTIPTIVPFLYSPRYDVRKDAAYALTRMKVLQPLRDAMNAEQAEVRLAALRALGKL
jgi:HEAT repeat protein